MPVVDTAPPVVARPKSCVSRSNSPQLRPACACAVRAVGIDADALHGPEVDDDAVVADRLAGDVVAAAAHRDGERVREAERQRRLDVGHAVAAGDDRGMLVDHAVVNAAGGLVLGVGRTDDCAAQFASQLVENGTFENNGHRNLLRQVCNRECSLQL